MYDAITKMLLKDSSLSLELGFFDINLGVTNIRTAGIWEPNPHKGKIVPMGDQSYCQGSVRKKEGYSFNAREINEGLDLVDRACEGEKDVDDTVSHSCSGNTIHGYNKPKGGLDNWMFADFIVGVQRKNGSLVSTLETYNFAAEGVVISRRKVASVEEAISPYNKHPQDIGVLRHIQRGALLQYKLLEEGRLDMPKHMLIKRNEDPRIAKRYEAALKSLAPLEISREAKNALFVSMLVERLYE